MSKQSAGILVFRISKGQPEVLLVHPGGPFYSGKDLGVWSVPKGEFGDDEEPLEVAKREFQEETGNKITSENFITLNSVRSKGGKTVQVWAIEENFDNCYISSNTFELEWPPKSGKIKLFPECDKAEWFTFDKAAEKIFAYQKPLIEQLQTIIKKNS
jgi:predicted NUDIX family NTP pyrophosphohydrolase